MPLPIARLNTKNEVWRELSEVGQIRDVVSGASSTLSAAATAGDTTYSVTSETGFAVGDFIRVGSGEGLEVRKVEATAAGVITTDLPILKDQDSGVEVVEQEKRNIGHVAESGLNIDVAPEFFELNSATFAGALIRRIVSIPQDVVIPLLNLSMANLALTAGQDEEEEVDGSGTASAPYRVAWLVENMAKLSGISVYATGLREDLTNLEMRFHSFDIDVAKSMTFARNAATELGFAGRADGGIEWLEWS